MVIIGKASSGDKKRNSNKFPSSKKHAIFLDEDPKLALNVLAMDFKESLIFLNHRLRIHLTQYELY